MKDELMSQRAGLFRVVPEQMALLRWRMQHGEAHATRLALLAAGQFPVFVKDDTWCGFAMTGP